jgi:gamma-glutamyl AIG2-like cyclotransferase
MSEWLFSYGTLQNEDTQLKLFGRRLSGTADVLEGYQIATIEILDVNFIARGESKFQKSLVCTNRQSDCVMGTALQLSEQELLLADQYEPANYKRTMLRLKSGIHVWVYIAQ